MKRSPDIRTIRSLPCLECEAQCCRYVAIEIDKPRSKRDYEYVRWYLLHRSINVFIDHEGKWFVEFETPCEALADDHRCKVYEERPQICREHGWPVGACEFFSRPCRRHFRNVRQFEAYLDRRGVDWRWKRRPRPAKT